MSYTLYCDDCVEQIIRDGNAESDFKKAIMEHEEVCDANDDDEDED